MPPSQVWLFAPRHAHITIPVTWGATGGQADIASYDVVVSTDGGGFSPSTVCLLARALAGLSRAIATRVDGTLYYVHQDHLGSTVAVSDAAGQAVGRVQYDPYGEVTGALHDRPSPRV